MAVRGVYSKEEEKMMESWKQTKEDGGWLGDDPMPGRITYPVFHRAATRDLILNMANGIQDPNVIKVNQRLVIPGPTPVATATVPPTLTPTPNIPPKLEIVDVLGRGAPTRTRLRLWRAMLCSFRPIANGILCSPITFCITSPTIKS